MFLFFRPYRLTVLQPAQQKRQGTTGMGKANLQIGMGVGDKKSLLYGRSVVEMVLWVKENPTAGRCADNWLAKREGRGWCR